MSILAGTIVIAVICSMYFGVRAVAVLFRAIAKLGRSRSFERLEWDQKLDLFYQAPTGDPRFRRFVNWFFGFFATSILLLGLAAPGMAQNGKPFPAWPLFLVAGMSALFAVGGAVAVRHSAPGIGALCQCASCGREMQITGMPQGGGVMMSWEEMESNMAMAGLCRECGRVYCEPCYSERGHKCECGRGRDKVTHEFGARYMGPMRLVKVQYL
jgi:hypothetical protein